MNDIQIAEALGRFPTGKARLARGETTLEIFEIDLSARP